MVAENIMFFQIHYTSSLRGQRCQGDRRRHRATRKEMGRRIGNAEGRLSDGERGMEVTRWPMLATKERTLAACAHLGLVIPRLSAPWRR